MKTKTKPQWKTVLALAAILYCLNSVVSFAQSPGPDKADFYGTWVGTDLNGNTIEIILNANSSCTFSINSLPDHSGNPIKAFRLPEYAALNTNTTATTNAALSTQPSADDNNSGGAPVTNSPFTGPQRTIKFFTQNAMRGIMATVSGDPHAPQSSNPDPNSMSLTSTVQAIYTGLALITVNGLGQYEMALYMDIDHFSTEPPAVDFSINPIGDIPVYANLIRQ